ncbi:MULTISPECIES: aldehyde dehydrogenase family protein [Staphylococcus]|jgi:aldehyde dehydrogenase (NAD+)|uniref:Aldehyde dehydrogenase n=1 Tax=Staphylococcus warneri TaxID=1292 RepID=A0A2T4Q200_STAWA|nr:MULTISPECIES: aldehyde dehydrogenase family protein [Staphylococcus]MBY6181213.1 aldehyde dehydrogenase family protein [Staphylococcaceae bacterium DP2N0-1]EEQ79530.1 aldehyde dehydrogenase (NAD) family protein [Staphylococcus warneri L37603]MBO0378251.1 aldehyde dehydrogenase family protein [Staphylococcus warneri]MCJ1804924.1 aldehyde dehydrogenase family protein [Staphylococcus warneri]PTI14238.1 aldehyde dehydrogenase family protein [Staphylococcus warneri]
MRHFTKQYINGEWVDSASGETIEVINPATEEVIGSVAKGNEEDVNKAVEAADNVYLDFRHSTVEYRRDLLDKIVKEYENRKEDIVQAITDELGAPLSVSEKVHYQMGLNHFTAARDALDSFEFEEQRGDDLVVKEAIGVAGLVTPWNFPTNQTSLKLAAAFAAGSAVVLKPSEETPFAAVILAEIFDKVGVPKGVFNLVNGDGEGVGNPLSEHPKVRMMSFTGSGPTGSKIMEKAAKDFKKVSLELGGKSPYIVLDDVDIEEAAKATTGKVVNNTGQVCTAGTRVLVPNSIKEDFLKAVKAQFSSVKVGDPREEGTQVGPIISKKQFDQVQSYIDKGIEEGAELFYGGPGKPEGLEKGYFARPTIFINVDNHMTIAQEEIFGPVMSVITYNDVDEAIKIANDTKYGLAGYVIGNDKDTLHKVARSIEAGTVEINEAGRKPDLPFGGYKQSGLGREWGDYGIEEFLEVKSIAGYFK